MNIFIRFTIAAFLFVATSLYIKSNAQELVVKTNNLIWLGFLIVYGVDAVMTILHRVFLRQNIFEPHRLHFYQILANERKVPHRVVSVIYFVLQLACSASIVFLYPVYGWWVFFALLAVLMGLYMLKFPLMHIVK